MTNLIETKALQKVYGKADKPAVDNLDLVVSQGEIFGLLGPNGAGKTTTVLMLTTLTRPTAGEGWVCGYNVVTNAEQVRSCIGYCPQETSVDEELTGWENMMLYARLSGLSRAQAREQVSTLFKTAGLEGRERDLVRHYSGGMRRRLEVMGALIHKPQILFLDEPTLGLDPQFRREMWHHIQQAREKGSSIFLTTHYMEEAEVLCDRVAIISEGQVGVVGPPADLRAEIGEVIRLGLLDPTQEPSALEQLRKVDGVHEIISASDGLYVFTSQGETLAAHLVACLREVEIGVKSFAFAPATLDDVFLRYSGRRMLAETI